RSSSSLVLRCKVNPSIHFLPLIPLGVAGGLEPISASSGEGGGHPGQVAMEIYCRDTSPISRLKFYLFTNTRLLLPAACLSSCASFVGCRGGAQKLYYSKSCSVGNLCHEIIHALGLHHEHTREDRDNYITVEWNNIMKHGNTLNLPYDLKSIMHYGQYFFSKDGSPTVLPKQNEAQMGQRRHLSELDIQKLNKLYHCGIPLFPYCVTCRFHITLLINRTN
uniref:Metalloendopeptidase n=1 Tax=Mola mola TaxID=94237 RepID=A0A3Q3WYK2_MOLML